jgi:hypothetical protein
MSTSPPPSVVIHADEVVGGIVHRRCPRCDVLKPLDLFGLRTMRASDGTTLVREQSWCRACRARPRAPEGGP